MLNVWFWCMGAFADDSGWRSAAEIFKNDGYSGPGMVK